MSVPDALFYPLAAALVALAFTKAAMELLPRVGLISLPDANHPQPVPVGGGIAVWMPTYVNEFRGVPNLREVNSIFGAILVVSGLAATLTGGLLGDRLRDRLPGSRVSTE